MGMMIGDPTTARVLQGLNQQLQGSRTPGQAEGIQQQMNAAQLQGAQNLLFQANNPLGPDGRPKQTLDPMLGYSPTEGARQYAQQNLSDMHQNYNRNQMAIQQAANNANPMTALGVPGYYPAAGGAAAATRGAGGTSPLLSALGG